MSGDSKSFFLINKNHFSNQNRARRSSGKRVEQSKCGVHTNIVLMFQLPRLQQSIMSL